MIEKKVELTIPDASAKVLMHSCCAPCSGELIEQILANGIGLTIFFYNPNIHPLKEYNLRKDENIRYAKKYNIEFIDADYDVQDWFKRIKGLENEPERGERCTKCFDMRFERTALYAYENGFSYFTTSLGLSRWKDMDQINEAGHRAALRYENVSYWDYNWRKYGGSERMYQISKRENFYKQEYCGCIYSLRDTNLWREKKGRAKIEIGKEFYTE
jgi:predicted adenine nucleotide alpha hydrolase (AANH) superfamily ATPase